MAENNEEQRLGLYESMEITGCLIAVHPDRQPMLLRHPTAGLSIAIFTTEARLHEGMRVMKESKYRIQQIDDQHEFLESIAESCKRGNVSIRVMLDPHVVDGDKMRWLDVQLPEVQ